MSQALASSLQTRAESVATRATSAARAHALKAARPSARRVVRARAEVRAIEAGEDTVIEAAGRLISVGSDGTIVISAGKATTIDAPDTAEVEYLTGRAAMVQQHFESALGADDFVQRVEMALHAFGFSGENSIAMVNLCRDEVTVSLKKKIDTVFGASFSTNGLGGVLTCGAIGMGAGFSHSPVCDSSGKERYIFFSFPHISINAKGEVGPMSRPGRPGQSYVSLLKAEGLEDVAALPDNKALQAAVSMKGEPARCATADNSTILIDNKFVNDEEVMRMRAELESKYIQRAK
uniref:LCI450 protein n=1 Tax=Chlorella sp. ArM0029B TaxID=1415603 RepID=A0A345AXC5_9CHLO|nr:LCI450 protein [Chlorella sp. ArM0029B]